MNPLSNSKKTLEYGSIDNAEEFIPLLSPIENNKDFPHTLEIQDNILTIEGDGFSTMFERKSTLDYPGC